MPARAAVCSYGTQCFGPVRSTKRFSSSAQAAVATIRIRTLPRIRTSPPVSAARMARMDRPSRDRTVRKNMPASRPAQITRLAATRSGARRSPFRVAVELLVRQADAADEDLVGAEDVRSGAEAGGAGV